MSLMLSSAKKEATELEIPLDFETCCKQLTDGFEDDSEIKEGFHMVYHEFRSLFDINEQSIL